MESHSHRIITGICPSMHDSPSMQKLQALLPWVSWDIRSHCIWPGTVCQQCPMAWISAGCRDANEYSLLQVQPE